MKKEEYQVKGMTCSGCERTVSKVVANLQGVAAAKADHNTSSLSVEYDPAKVTVEQMKEAVNKVGYKFVGTKVPNN
jgi:mercuric ion transport protein